MMLEKYASRVLYILLLLSVTVSVPLWWAIILVRGLCDWLDEQWYLYVLLGSRFFARRWPHQRWSSRSTDYRQVYAEVRELCKEHIVQADTRSVRRLNKLYHSVVQPETGRKVEDR